MGLTPLTHILMSRGRWLGNAALIYHQKRFMNMQREIKLSGLKRNNLVATGMQKSFLTCPMMTESN